LPDHGCVIAVSPVKRTFDFFFPRWGHIFLDKSMNLAGACISCRRGAARRYTDAVNSSLPFPADFTFRGAQHFDAEEELPRPM